MNALTQSNKSWQDRSGEKAPSVAQKAAAIEDLAFLSLPSRKELETESIAPAMAPISQRDGEKLEKRQSRLQSDLAQINYRLSNGLEKPKSFRRLMNSLAHPDEQKYVKAGGVAAVSFMLGAIGSLFLSGYLSSGLPLYFSAPLVVAGAAVGAASCGLGGWLAGLGIYDPNNEARKVKAQVFNNNGRPSRYLLEHVVNPFIKVRALFYKGPDCKEAREFDNELYEIKNSRLPYHIRVHRREMAREALLVVKEQKEGELSAINAKLKSRQEEKKRTGCIGQVSGMLEGLIEKLAIPEEADNAYMEEVSQKSYRMLKAVRELRKNRAWEVPQDLPAVRYFSNILSLLEKNGAGEDIRTALFEKFTEALCDRLKTASRALGQPAQGIED